MMDGSFLRIIFIFAIASRLCASVVVNKKAQRAPHHKLLLVSFDGFRWDYIDRAPDLEGFKRLTENGVRAKYLQPAFPTQTSPNHFSIATGLYVESHGVVHNCNYNISNPGAWSGSTFYSTLAVNEWWDNGAEPIWITAVRQGLKSGGNLYPGSYATMNGDSATKKALEEVQTPKEEEDWYKRINMTMRWFTEDNLDMVALYFEQPDSKSHEYGPEDPRIETDVLPLVSRTIMYLLDRIDDYGLTDDLNVILTSDHGFETIDVTKRPPDTISLANYVNLTEVDFMFAYGPLGLVEPALGSEDKVYEDLKAGNANMKVYRKEELPDRWHYKNNERVTSIVVVSEPGFSVYQKFVFHVNKGEHGYDNHLEKMRASYFSIGPSFKKNYMTEGFENVNIYPLMCHLLGLEPAPNNGSLDVLKDTLVAFDTTTMAAVDTTSSSGKLNLNTNCILIMLLLASLSKLCILQR